MFLPSEIEDFKKTMSEIMKEVRKNEALMVRMAEYDTELRDYALFCNSLIEIQPQLHMVDLIFLTVNLTLSLSGPAYGT